MYIKATYINNWGAHFDVNRIFRIFCNGWIDCREAFYVCCSLFITLRNRLEMSQYEAYWETDFPLIIYWAHDKKYM